MVKLQIIMVSTALLQSLESRELDDGGRKFRGHDGVTMVSFPRNLSGKNDGTEGEDTTGAWTGRPTQGYDRRTDV